MKIALYEMLVTVSYGGIQTSYWETAKRLCARGHEVHMYGGEGDIRWDMPDGVRIYTFPFVSRSRFPDFGTRFRKFAERLSFGRHALPSLIRNRYDVIYIRKPYEMPISLYVRRRTGARVVYRSGGTEFYPGYRYLASRLDALLACSRHNASQIRNYCGLQPDVLYNGVDTERYIPLPPSRSLAERFGLKEKDFVVMSVGRLVGWKGFRYGIRAVSMQRDPRVKYVIVGDGDQRMELEREARTLGVGDRVVFAGSVPHQKMPEIYSVANAVLFPTIGDDDAFPNALCEAMACGKPVIGATRGGIPEGIVEGQTGFLVPPADAEAISERIAFLAENRDRAGQMGAASRRRAEESFSWDLLVGRLASLFEDLAERKGRG